jgi:zinc transport system ATP-binding protein
MSSPIRPALLQLHQLGLTLSGQRILSDINLEVFAGEIVTVIGPNGAGKSSLLKIMLSTLKPSEGHMHQQSNLSIGYLPQHFQLEPTLPISVVRFLRLTQQRFSHKDARRVLSEVGASRLADKAMQQLSGGELQRVLLARTLLINPQLLILDEPMQGVDVRGQAQLYQLLSQIKHQRGCAIVLVSHDLHLVMAATDRVICLNQHICCQGSPHSVQQDPHYQALFAPDTLNQLAIYSHHHDHVHHLDGHVDSSPADSVENHSHCNHQD